MASLRRLRRKCQNHTRYATQEEAIASARRSNGYRKHTGAFAAPMRAFKCKYGNHFHKGHMWAHMGR